MPSDAAYAVRQLRRSPAFAAAAILTLALGIGANAAIYQVLDAVLFRVLPVKDPARLVRVTPFRDGKPKAFSYSDFRAIAGQPVFDGALASADFPSRRANRWLADVRPKRTAAHRDRMPGFEAPRPGLPGQ